MSSINLKIFHFTIDTLLFLWYTYQGLKRHGEVPKRSRGQFAKLLGRFPAREFDPRLLRQKNVNLNTDWRFSFIR